MPASPPSDRGHIYFSFPPHFEKEFRDISQKLTTDKFSVSRLPQSGATVREAIRQCDLFVGIYDYDYEKYQADELHLAKVLRKPRLSMASAIFNNARLRGSLVTLLDSIKNDRNDAIHRLIIFNDAKEVAGIIHNEVRLFFENDGRFASDEAAVQEEPVQAASGEVKDFVPSAGLAAMLMERGRTEAQAKGPMSSDWMREFAKFRKIFSDYEVASAAYKELLAHNPDDVVSREALKELEEDWAKRPRRAAKKRAPAPETKASEESEQTRATLSLSEGAEGALLLAIQLRESLGKKFAGVNMLLASLFLSPYERAVHNFLSPFVKQEDLLRQLWWQTPGKTPPPGFDLEVIAAEAYSYLPLAPKDSSDEFLKENSSDELLYAQRIARGLARVEGADKINARHLFAGALVADAEGSRWVESFLDAETAEWLREVVVSWPEDVPVTREAVNERLVQGRKFTTPETHRDSAAEKDLLGFKEHAEALAEIIRKKETQAPLVIGVYGPWGSGKSTFMGLVKRRLDELNRAAAGDEEGGRFRRLWKRLRRHFSKGRRSLKLTTVDYDAWAYVDAPKLWAGLVGKIAKELDAELTLRDRLAYLAESHFRRLLAAALLGLVPAALFVLGYAAERVPGWLSDSGLLGTRHQPFSSTLGWTATAAWAAFAYFVQKRPVTQAVAALAARFDTAPAAGVISRIQDEFKSALRAKIEGEPRPATAEARWPGIRARIRNNELKIVVFIDELDRCPLERIVEILEAIKLFLAEDIFIVLLGVDTRVASEAIRLHYKEVRNPDLPREYLEKIVQLPLRVPSAGRAKLEEYLKGFMNVPEDEPSKEAGRGAGAHDAPKPDDAGEPPRDFKDNGGGPGNRVETPATPAPREPERVKGASGVGNWSRGVLDVDPALSRVGRRAELAEPPQVIPAALPQLPDTRAEFVALSSIAENFLDSNPRRIKRLLNTYRYVKILAARLPGSEVHTAAWQTRMLYWLAFTMRWPTFMEASVETALAEVEKPAAERQVGAFLLQRLQPPDPRQERPAAELVEKHLPLDAFEVVSYYELAPNFLIENPGAAEPAQP
jgi:hypothetical protein